MWPPPAKANELSAEVLRIGPGRAVVPRVTDLDEVEARRQLRGDVDDDGLPVVGRGVEGGGHRRRRVDDDQITRAQPRRQIPGGRVARRLVADRDQHAHRVAPAEADLRRLRGLELGGQLEAFEERAHDATSTGTTRWRPLRSSPSMSASEARHRRLGQRPVRDVLAGEGVLVHLGPHVARINGQHPELRVFDGEDPPDVIERRLRRAVSTPTLVGLDGRVRRDVDDHATAGDHARQRRLDQSPRSSTRKNGASAAGSVRTMKRSALSPP